MYTIAQSFKLTFFGECSASNESKSITLSIELKNGSSSLPSFLFRGDLLGKTGVPKTDEFEISSTLALIPTSVYLFSFYI